MTVQDYLLHLFYLIDTEYAALDLGRVRERGPAPTLHDSEVLTIGLAGEFLGMDADADIFAHFRRYHAAEFPRLADVSRTAFARQSANLWRVEQLLQGRLVGRLPTRDEVTGEPLWLVDSFPLPACRFARAKGSKLFEDQRAAFGYDHVARQTFFGFRVHVRVAAGTGVVAAVELAPANAADVSVAADVAPPGGGVGVGDRNYWSPDGQAALARAGFDLLAPFKSKARDPDRGRTRTMTLLRRLVETVIGQLTTRFHAGRTRARDLWHLCHRLTRKVLSHTAAMVVNQSAGNPPLQLALLLDG